MKQKICEVWPDCACCVQLELYGKELQDERKIWLSGKCQSNYLSYHLYQRLCDPDGQAEVPASFSWAILSSNIATKGKSPSSLNASRAVEYWLNA
jgi:hypothetical protein